MHAKSQGASFSNACQETRNTLNGQALHGQHGGWTKAAILELIMSICAGLGRGRLWEQPPQGVEG